MFSRLMKYGFLCLALGCWHSGAQAALLSGTARAEAAVLAGTAEGIQAQSRPLFALAAVLVTEAQAADRQFEESESRSQHADRINRNLLAGTTAILTLFVIFRLLLVWQISRNRKKQAQDLLEGEL